MADPISPRAIGPIYEDANYKYFGEAVPGTALTAALWSVSRMSLTNGRVEWVAEGSPTSVYTDLATVAALTFA